MKFQIMSPSNREKVLAETEFSDVAAVIARASLQWLAPSSEYASFDYYVEVREDGNPIERYRWQNVGPVVKAEAVR